LSPSQGRQTFDATLYLGVRLGTGTELWLNAEIDQGFGLDNTLGAAGFPSGEAYKVGKQRPYLRLPRAFVRQTLGLGGTPETVDGAPNQLAGSRDADRLVLTLGKLSVGDVFDTSPYAHDPRVDFLNWAAVDAGSFDYAADAWGYTVGAAAEWYAGAWTLRGGAFDLSNVPNSEHLEPAGHEFQLIAELEHRHELRGQAGRVFVTGFQTHGRMALLDEAVQAAETNGAGIDLAAARRYRTRAGVHVGIEQRLTADVALFARAGGAAGNVEAYEFTDIDRALAIGASIRGAAWNRGRDTFGLALLRNDISAARRRFLAAGGLGILVGDGRLPHAATEQIVETYYSAGLAPWAFVTLDYQWIAHPAYNRDRGPASIVALRLHAQF
jgi:high affinity Mn2+ porin